MADFYLHKSNASKVLQEVCLAFPKRVLDGMDKLIASAQNVKESFNIDFSRTTPKERESSKSSLRQLDTAWIISGMPHKSWQNHLNTLARLIDKISQNPIEDCYEFSRDFVTSVESAAGLCISSFLGVNSAVVHEGFYLGKPLNIRATLLGVHRGNAALHSVYSPDWVTWSDKDTIKWFEDNLEGKIIIVPVQNLKRDV